MPTLYNGSVQEKRALNAYICLYRAADTITERVTKNIQASGITTSQFALLECLYHHGSMNPSHLAKKTLKSCGNMTFIIDKLEKKGWLKREAIPNERRSHMVTLKQKGKDIVEEWLPTYVNNIKNNMALLSLQEQNSLRELCRKIGLGS